MPYIIKIQGDYTGTGVLVTDSVYEASSDLHAKWSSAINASHEKKVTVTITVEDIDALPTNDD